MTKREAKEDRFTKMRDSFARAVENEIDLRQLALDDIRFVWYEGYQWDERLRLLRQSEGRPCYEYNKLKPTIKQITNDQRQNRPQVKVRAVEGADKSTADVYQGLIRNIESNSDADIAYDEAFRMAVSGGFGVWSLSTDYVNDNGFDLCIRINAIRNPFSVHWDENAVEWNRSDAREVWETDLISREEFEARWPKAETVDFDSYGVGDNYMRQWWHDDSVRIAKYWYKVKAKKKIYRLSTDEIVDAEEFDPIADELQQPGLDEQGQVIRQPITIVDTREIETDKVMVEIVSGKETLEGPFEWAGKYIPVIPVWGELTNIDGRDRYCGLVRTARDAQSNYNYHRSVTQEAIANAPKSPFLVTPKMIAGHELQWQRIGVANEPAVFYNPDPEAPGGRPTREPPPDFPAALVNAAQLDAEDLKAVTGIYDASLGARSNETSGRAIMARQREGDVATFDFIDNMSRALKYQGQILVDLIPKIYDTQRVIRVLGEDGTEDYVKLHEPVFDQQSGHWITKNDLSRGQYDVSVTVGPSYTTQRMEMADAMMQLAQGGGPDAALAKYAAMKAMDTPGMDEILKGFRKMLVGQGILDPGEDDAPPQPPPPNPLMVAEGKVKEAQANKYNADAQVSLAKLPSQVHQSQANADRATAEAFAIQDNQSSPIGVMPLAQGLPPPVQ